MDGRTEQRWGRIVEGASETFSDEHTDVLALKDKDIG